MHELLIDGSSLSFEQVVQVAHDPTLKVQLSEVSKVRILKAAQAVEDFVREGKIVYGITTGFGAFKDRIIPPEKVKQLQRNILFSHAVGVGDPLDQPTVRAMMLIRANTLARGHSGIRLETLELLLNMLNLGIHPIIPEKGSLGASGDLAPLAHMALPLIGEGEVTFQGKRMPTMQAFKIAGLQAIDLCAKEGLALTNGTTLMTALGVLNLHRACNLIHTANLAAAMTLEALKGTPRAFDPRIHALRPYPLQQETAQTILKLIDGSQLIRTDDSTNCQDSYTLRCIPQVHGAVHEAINYAQSVVNIELNAVTDNPLIFFDEQDHPEIISGGNFHGEPLAFAMDFLGIALTDLGNISERRIMKMLDESMNHHLLPGFLTTEGGLNSGFMLLQYTAAALCSENKVLSHPSSTDTIPSSANVEDHVSMGANAALHARSILDNLETILSIELICAAQALDFRLQSTPAARMSIAANSAYSAIRNCVPFFEHDAITYPYITKLQQLIRSGTFQSIVLDLTDKN